MALPSHHVATTCPAYGPPEVDTVAAGAAATAAVAGEAAGWVDQADVAAGVVVGREVVGCWTKTGSGLGCGRSSNQRAYAFSIVIGKNISSPS
ncbi:MAG: hypothetical protein H6766_06850 [Candidatus Peribacteria bacterium]|nr:MAG: hypothetical protein H6766_06850 [Candidatus Peribacteria bacterium]